MWAEVKHAQIKCERATSARVEAEDIKSRADEAAAAEEQQEEEGASASGSGAAAESQELW